MDSSSPAEQLINNVEVRPVQFEDGDTTAQDWKPGDVPYVTHQGILKIGEIEIDVVVLNTGQRLMTGRTIESIIKSIK